ncbi:diguanylate cyclase [Azohydromonas caseinilytica]|uniref:diguanylate cyclase n=1 Tax=Azohydromonas caseinilytica TaxID=2728836 RepID=A0A848F8I8_9BURK|nr:diguanylate cyclase [Azohydromonas caseinilytica]NML15672.1 diguanylate cyclase [Azohydromonas caseinilytica]
MAAGQAIAAIAASAAHRPGMGLVHRVYVPRMLGLGLGGLAVGATLQQRDALYLLWPLLVGHALLWPHLAHWRARRAPQPRRAEHVNLLADAFGGGFWLAAMAFNLLPSVLVATMLGMNHLAVGGLRLFRRGLMALALGTVTGGALLGWELQPLATQATVAACLPFLVSYPLVIGIVTYRLSLRLAEQKAQLRELVQFDPLTGLLNKMHWHAQMESEFARWRRSARPVALMLLDLDHFKRINDEHGHPAGDEVLRHFSRLLRHHVREADVAGRVGGEEFAVLVHDCSAEQAQFLARRVRAALAAQPVPVAGGLHVTVSVGIAEPGRWQRDAAQWLAEADAALYTAKREGRDQVCLAPRRPR